MVFVREVIQKFCVSDPFSIKNQQMDFKPKKLYLPGSNLFFDMIAILSEAFYLLIDEFVDACGIPHWVFLLDGLPLQDLSLVLVHPILNLCTY